MAVGAPSIRISLVTRNVERSTTATDRLSSLATKIRNRSGAGRWQDRVGAKASRKARRFIVTIVASRTSRKPQLGWHLGEHELRLTQRDISTSSRKSIQERIRQQ